MSKDHLVGASNGGRVSTISIAGACDVAWEHSQVVIVWQLAVGCLGEQTIINADHE